MNSLISSFLLVTSILNPASLTSKNGQLVVKVSEQKIYYYKDFKLEKTFDISTSKYGLGNQEGSNKTPLGKHRVVEKIGDSAPIGTVFIGRKNKNYVLDNLSDNSDPDYVTTRILWLEGLEDGINKGIGIDSYERFIYIHGTAEENKIGKPASHGCIRMKNTDVVDLYDKVDAGVEVLIVE